MSAINTLINNKRTILAVVSEHYFLSPEEKREMEFRPFDNHACSTPDNVIYHGAWTFCYHRDVGVLYVK